MTHRRTLADADKLGLVAVRQGGGLLVEKSRSQDVLLAIHGKRRRRRDPQGARREAR